MHYKHTHGIYLSNATWYTYDNTPYYNHYWNELDEVTKLLNKLERYKGTKSYKYMKRMTNKKILQIRRGRKGLK